MNNNLRQYGFYIGFILLLFFLGACSKMNSTYQDFWKNGENIYPASPDSIKVFSGKNRIEMTFTITGGTSVTKATIYWNNKTDSMEVPIKRDEKHSKDTINVMLKNLPEGYYSFDIYTYDDQGNRSVVVNAIGRSYGDSYTSSLLSRLIESASYVNDTATIVWSDPVDESSIGSEIKYKDITGTSRLFVGPSADTTFITGMAFTAGDAILSRTLYVPDSTCIDTFYTAYDTVRVLGPRTILQKTGWTATASSYDNRGGRTDRTPDKSIDGDLSTGWVNLVGSTDFPHTYTVDMGSEMGNIYGISIYLHDRKETPETLNIYISDDGIHWQLMGLFSTKKENGRQFLDFQEPQSLRYFRAEYLTSYGSPNIIVYGIGVYTR